MAITVICETCGKKIDAPEKAAGKWGKCPGCQSRVFVPQIENDEDDELRLAPIDEAEEQRKRQLLAESFRIEQDILSQKNAPPEESRTSKKIPSDDDDLRPIDLGLSEVGDQTLTKNIIVYLRLMADGDLEGADQNLELITPYGPKAIEILDDIALSEIPEPELADIPQQVLSGFIRTLRSQIE